ncbi:MAG: hypothetical protein K6T17_03305 [Fimbriimonadales bacterium]|nr:hypothetical protein [Fimbriimonadales bacterium]
MPTLYALHCLGFQSLDSEHELKALLQNIAARSAYGYEETLHAYPFPGCRILIQLDFSGEPQRVRVGLHTPAQAIVPFEITPRNEEEAFISAFTWYGEGVGEAFSFVATGPWEELEKGKVAFAMLSAFAMKVEPCGGEPEEAGFGEPIAPFLMPVRAVVLDVQHPENWFIEDPVSRLDLWVPGLRLPLVCPRKVSPEVGTLVSARALLLGEISRD